MPVLADILARLVGGPLRDNRVFRRLLASQVTLSFGQQLSALALPTVAILFLNAGPMEVGILAALPWISSPLVGPLAGTLIDRLPRRPVMVAADSGRFLCLLAIAISLLAGQLNLYQLYVVAFVFGCLGLFYDVAFQANLPATFGDGELLEANSRIELLRSPGLVGGAGLAGLVISGVGPARGLFATALTFLFSAISLAGIKPPEASPVPDGPRASLLRETAGGMAMILRNPILRSIATSTAVSNFGLFMFLSVSLVFAYRSLHLSAALIGLVVAAGNVGYLFGASLAPMAARRLGLGRTLALSQLFMAFSLFFAPLALLGMPVIMLSASLLLQNLHTNVYSINQITLRQAITPHQAQGRMNASMRALILVAVPFGSVLGGYLGTTLGLPQTMLLGGAIALLAPLFLLVSPVVRLAVAPRRAPLLGGLAPAEA